MSDSVELDIRCKSCGKQIEGATATIRANSNGGGERIRSQAKWILGRLQCRVCAERDGKK